MRRNLTILLLLSLCIGLYIPARHFLKAQKRKEDREIYKVLVPEIGISLQDDFYTKVDKTRVFISRNSTHKIDDEFYSYWGNAKKVVAKFHDKLAGKSETGPHLECSSRTGIMLKMLENMGYQTREVIVYKAKDNFPSHVYLEVKNPKTESWHIQDPDYDIFWKMKKTGARASVADLWSHRLKDFEPCLNDEKCGWNIINREGRKPKSIKGSFGLAYVQNHQTGEKTLHVNAARFPLEKRVLVDGRMESYCEMKPRNCQRTIIKYDVAE
jgi:hypothetical protein